MLHVRTVHTATLTTDELRAVRGLLDAAFDGGFGDDDFEHAVGGMHAVVHDGAELVGHGSVVMRRLLHGGTALRAGYVEGVAVRADRRRRGIGALMMDELHLRHRLSTRQADAVRAGGRIPLLARRQGHTNH